MISQLVYVSDRELSCTQKEVNKILVNGKENNTLMNITGILLYSEHRFIQFLEGEETVIMDLYSVIKKDLRHRNAMLVLFEPIKERFFPSWQMGSKSISENEAVFKTKISSHDKVIFDNILSGKEEDGQKVLNLIKKFF